VLIAAHNAIKSAAEVDGRIPQADVDKKFRVAFDLLYHFVKDFSTLNPNTRDARFTRLIDKQGLSRIAKLHRPSSPHFTNLCHMRHLESYSSVEFPSDFSSLNADES
jgi:hypothetical protein